MVEKPMVLTKNQLVEIIKFKKKIKNYLFNCIQDLEMKQIF